MKNGRHKERKNSGGQNKKGENKRHKEIKATASAFPSKKGSKRFHLSLKRTAITSNETQKVQRKMFTFTKASDSKKVPQVKERYLNISSLNRLRSFTFINKQTLLFNHNQTALYQTTSLKGLQMKSELFICTNKLKINHQIKKKITSGLFISLL